MIDSNSVVIGEDFYLGSICENIEFRWCDDVDSGSRWLHGNVLSTRTLSIDTKDSWIASDIWSFQRTRSFQFDKVSYETNDRYHLNHPTAYVHISKTNTDIGNSIKIEKFRCTYSEQSFSLFVNIYSVFIIIYFKKIYDSSAFTYRWQAMINEYSFHHPLGFFVQY